MNRFFILVTIITFPIFAIGSSKIYTYSTSETIERSLDEIQSMIKDRESYCENCKYKIENLIESKIVANRGGNPFYVYNSVQKMGAYPNFTVITSKKIARDITIITIQYVSEKMAAELTELTGYDHKQPFEQLNIKWTLNKVSPKRTDLRYDVLLESNNPLVKMVWSQVKKTTQRRAKAVIQMFKSS